MGLQGRAAAVATSVALAATVTVGWITPAGADPPPVVVTTTADELAADGDCSLREAIQTVNTGVGVDTCAAGSTTIELPAGTFAYDPAELGVLTATTSMTLRGAGRTATTIRAEFLETALRATAGVALTLEDLQVEGGTAVDVAAGGGTLTLIDAGADGSSYAVVTNDSDLTADGSLIEGGLFGTVQTTSGDLDLATSEVVSDNEGTGLRSTAGSITVTDSSVTGPLQAPTVVIDRSYLGPCIECTPLPMGAGSLTLTNSTVEVPLDQPAITLTTGSATITSATIYSTPGDPAVVVTGSGQATVTGSIVSCSSATGLVSGGGNVSDGGCGFAATADAVGAPLLGAATDNGGPTPTRLPAAGSPALDHAPTCPTVDQRGLPRPADGDGDGSAVCDAGAVEAAAPPPPPPPPPITSKLVVGDWDGDGDDSPGLVDSNLWRFRNDLTTGGAQQQATLVGTEAGTPVVGDWDGDGDDDIGVAVQEANVVRWNLRTLPATGLGPDIVFTYGRSGTPVTGDWDGDGDDDIGLVQGSTWFLRTSRSPGPADLVGRFGVDGDVRLPGDWDGDGTDTVGFARGTTRFLLDGLGGGPADLAFRYGSTTDRPLVGDWDGDGIDTPGIARSTTSGIAWHLRDANSSGPADVAFRFGP